MTNDRWKRTPENLEKAQALREAGASYEAIGWHLDVTYDTARAWLDETYAAKRRARINFNRKTRRQEIRRLYSLYAGKP